MSSLLRITTPASLLRAIAKEVIAGGLDVGDKCTHRFRHLLTPDRRPLPSFVTDQVLSLSEEGTCSAHQMIFLLLSAGLILCIHALTLSI